MCCLLLHLVDLAGSLQHSPHTAQSGRIINISGAGFNGWATPNFAPYGATKAAMAQLTKSLARETRASGCGVAVDCAGPGMMLTDLLLSGEKSKSVYKVCVQPCNAHMGCSARPLFSSHSVLLNTDFQHPRRAP